ncbi:MAG: LytTR family transcriptional regulator [Ruminococcaceae bacterium]|nr:LytTR family transcriptional regulator [Oscillospiraceae bacterium]
MQIEIKIDSSCVEPKVIVLTDRMSDEVNEILRRLSEEAPKVIAGFREDTLEILEPNEIVRIYAASGKVIAVTDRGEYTLRQRLYELEEKLDKARFIRISNSEIVNLRKVRSFDLSMAGTICVSLKNGENAFVSRRYVSRIRQVLGI